MSYQEALYVEGKKEGKAEGKIEGTIETSFRLGRNADEVLKDIIEIFSLSQEKAEEYVDQFKPV